MKKEEKMKQNWEEDESDALNIEVLTEIQGGIEDDGKGTASCGLGCFQGSGGLDTSTNE